MKNLILEKCEYIAGMEDIQFSSMAFDGCFFYLTNANCPVIYQINFWNEIECIIHTKRRYTVICYDCVEKCFWGTCSQSIFKLSNQFEECDMLDVKLSLLCGITSLSYDYACNILVVYTNNKIYRVCKNGNCQFLYGNNKKTLSSCGCTFGDILLINWHFFECDSSVIDIMEPDCCIKNRACLPSHFWGKSFLLAFEDPGYPCIFVFALKNGRYPYRLKFKIVKQTTF